MTRGRKVLLLGSLYLAQGLPFGFFTQALPVLLRDAGYSLVQISASGLLFLPWALKFAWAPLVDRHGTRRQWLVALQLASAATAAAMATLDLSSTMTWLFVGITISNLLAATQDIATDGLAINLLGPAERGIGNGLQVGAYRLGMVIGGGALLALFAVSGWRSMFLVMAGLLALLVVPTLLVRDPTSAPGTALVRPHAGAQVQVTALYSSGGHDGTGWLARLLQPGMLAFAVLLVVFKLGDSMGSGFIGPYLRDTGLTLSEIALLKGTVASLVVLVGAAVGAWLTWRLRRRTAILAAGVLQAAAMGFFVIASVGIGGLPMVVAACVAEAGFGGIANVVLFTLMMDASDEEHAGTDYSLLACALVGAQGLAAVSGGVVGDLLGWPALFTTAFVVASLGAVAMVLALGRGVGPARLHDRIRLHARQRSVVPTH
jgi:MFS family permease